MNERLPLPEPEFLYYRPSFLVGESLRFTGYTADQMRQYADDANAALREQVRGPTPDCRTCSHYRLAERVDCCADICTNADRYDPMPVVQLWRTP